MTLNKEGMVGLLKRDDLGLKVFRMGPALRTYTYQGALWTTTSLILNILNTTAVIKDT
jgi:hypothetical protein